MTFYATQSLFRSKSETVFCKLTQPGSSGHNCLSPSQGIVGGVVVGGGVVGGRKHPRIFCPR